MQRKLYFTTNCARLLLAVWLLALGGPAAQAQTSVFTYQGQLTDGGAPANGPYDLQFSIYDAATDGEHYGTILRGDVNVVNGSFTTTLDFGPEIFSSGGPRWLEISVRPGASTGAYTTLTPRREITSVPYAIRALSAETVTGAISASQLYGALPASVVPPGGFYVNNSATLQSNANFNIGGDGTVGGTLSASTVSGFVVKAATQFNLGAQRVLTADAAKSNLFTGLGAGTNNTSGVTNSFFGANAGFRNTGGAANSFFGYQAGNGNTGGSANSFFGSNAGLANSSGHHNSAFGLSAGENNSTGSYNSSFGGVAGASNTSSSGNSFFGGLAGYLAARGDNNTFVGYNAGTQQTDGNNNTLLGANSNLTNGLSFATAIGAGATVSSNNTVVLGRTLDQTLVAGPLVLNNLPGGGNTNLCVAGSVVRLCSSSQRYKNNVQPLLGGLKLIQRLRPVSFDWKDRAERDLGLIAEEVAEVEPLLTFRNEKGEIEGVKYAQLSIVLINAVKEQQAQIEQQQKQIRRLQQLICAGQLADADFCQTDKRAK